MRNDGTVNFVTFTLGAWIPLLLSFSANRALSTLNLAAVCFGLCSGFGPEFGGTKELLCFIIHNLSQKTCPTPSVALEQNISSCRLTEQDLVHKSAAIHHLPQQLKPFPLVSPRSFSSGKPA